MKKAGHSGISSGYLPYAYDITPIVPHDEEISNLGSEARCDYYIKVLQHNRIRFHAAVLEEVALVTRHLNHTIEDQKQQIASLQATCKSFSEESNILRGALARQNKPQKKSFWRRVWEAFRDNPQGF